jgi:hypothetical protein
MGGHVVFRDSSRPPWGARKISLVAFQMLVSGPVSETSFHMRFHDVISEPVFEYRFQQRDSGSMFSYLEMRTFCG